jgi:MFS family permease
MGRSLRAAICDRSTIAAAAAIVIAGGTTGVSALLVPDQLHAAGASAAKIGVAFAVSGVLFVAGSALTASVGSRAIRIPVILAGMLALALAFTPAVLASAPFAIVAMLCATTTARSVLWTVSYPLAALGAERSGAGLGVVMGMLNGVWAATVLLGPVAAGLAAESFSAQAVFGLTAVACVAIFAVTVLAGAGSWRGRPGGRRATGGGPRLAGPARPGELGDVLDVQR